MIAKPAVFGVASTIWSGGCPTPISALGENGRRSPIPPLATLLAMFATDGAAEIGVIAG